MSAALTRRLEAFAPARGAEFARFAGFVLLCFAASRALHYGVYLWGAVPGGRSFAQALCQFDCGWYLHTATHGYDTAPHAHDAGDAANWAFFPLYQALVALVAALTTLPPLLAGILLSNILAIATGLLAFAYFDSAAARRYFVVILSFAPFSFYLNAVYTESLFLFLVMGGLVALKSGAFLRAGAWGFLLSAARPVGVFFCFAMLVAMLREHLRAGGRWRGFPAHMLRRPELITAILFSVSGLFGFMVYLHWHMGDAFAFSHVQRAWGREIGNPLAVLWDALGANDLALFLAHDHSRQWCAAWTLLWFALAGVLAARRMWPECIFAMFCLVVPLATSIQSMPRYGFGVAPLLIAAALVLERLSPGVLRAGLVLAALNIPLLAMWFAGHGGLI